MKHTHKKRRKQSVIHRTVPQLTGYLATIFASSIAILVIVISATAAGDTVLADEIVNVQPAVVWMSVPVWQYDFDATGSPTMAGYLSVTLNGYSASLGYGWEDPTDIRAIDNTASDDPLTRDVHRSRDGTFIVDLENGTYTVEPLLGSASMDRAFDGISINGELVDGNLSTEPGQFLTPTYHATITNGKLVLHIVNQTGRFFSIAGLKISETGK